MDEQEEVVGSPWQLDSMGVARHQQTAPSLLKKRRFRCLVRRRRQAFSIHVCFLSSYLFKFRWAFRKQIKYHNTTNNNKQQYTK